MKVVKGKIFKERVLIRDPRNIVTSMSQDQVELLRKKFKFQGKSLDSNQQKVLNYVQLFDTFLNIFTEMGRGKTTSFIFEFKGQELKFDINICFSNRLGVDIFEPNVCPLFMLQML